MFIEEYSKFGDSTKSPWRIIFRACLIYLIIGYILYFSLQLLLHFDLANFSLDNMGWLIPAINISARVNAYVGTSAFSAQAIIIYSTLGSIYLTILSIYTFFIVEKFRRQQFEYISEKIKVQKTSIFGVLLQYLFTFGMWFIFPVFLFLQDTALIDRQAIKIYSSSVISSTVFLFAGLINVISVFLTFVMYVRFFSRSSTKGES